jgi:hypothetical protein
LGGNVHVLTPDELLGGLHQVKGPRPHRARWIGQTLEQLGTTVLSVSTAEFFLTMAPLFYTDKKRQAGMISVEGNRLRSSLFCVREV